MSSYCVVIFADAYDFEAEILSPLATSEKKIRNQKMTKTVKWDVLPGKFDFRSVCKLVDYGAFCVLMPLEAFTICLFLTRRNG